MAKIKFSHAYKKLHDTDGKCIKSAKLLLVIPVTNDFVRVAKDFLEYDTDNGKYMIPYSTWYLMLLFLKPNGDLFTTVRPQWSRFGDKKPYYDKLVGCELEVIISAAEEVQKRDEVKAEEVRTIINLDTDLDGLLQDLISSDYSLDDLWAARMAEFNGRKRKGALLLLKNASDSVMSRPQSKKKAKEVTHG